MTKYVWTSYVPEGVPSGHFTEGKRYKVTNEFGYGGANVVDDLGVERTLYLPGCAWLNGKAWNVEEREEETTTMTNNTHYFKSVSYKDGRTVLTIQFPDSEVLSVDNTHANFKAVVEKEKECQEAIRLSKETCPELGSDFDNDFYRGKSVNEHIEELRDLMRVDRALARISGGRVTLENGNVLVDGNPVNTWGARKIMRMYQEGHSVDSYLKVMERIQQNPDARLRGERGDDGDIMRFVDYGSLCVSPEGEIIAYKVVNSDFTSKADSTTDNTPGNVVELRENEVDNDPHRTCSRGLHACSKEYALGFFYSAGDKFIAVAIAPEDIRAIPVDYNNTKLRCVRYRVVCELNPDQVEKDVLAKRAVFEIPEDGRTVFVDEGDDVYDDDIYDWGDEDEEDLEEDQVEFFFGGFFTR